MKNKHIITIFAIGIAIVGLLAMFANQHYNHQLDQNKTFGVDIEAIKCPACTVCEACQSSKITAQRIIDDNPLIELPNETVSFKYNGEVFTKKMLEEAKIINER